ncbi:carbamoyltransferase C-terminal domain-containing protein [Paenibacillus humicus]|uniref:carbamoyltransferase C-terminal domain-containing protein n=1 Tax=Paenibacillus humicus TaxID=412861 RepID=UPI003D2D35D4
MKDGFYLSTYIHYDQIAHLLDLNIRHDQNIALWRKESDNVELIHYWELERFSGYKGHYKSFYDRNEAIHCINRLLSEYKLSIDEMIEIWGTPGLSDSCTEIPFDGSLAYHSIGHLFSALLLDTDIFYKSNIIGLAVDGGPDNVVDADALTKYYYAGCVSIQGKVETFPIYSPGMLWDYARHKYKLREGTLMALGSASKSELLINLDELILINNYSCLEQAYQKIDNIMTIIDSLKEEDKGIKFNYFDENFSVQDNKISMFVKVLQSISYRIMEHNINLILEKSGLKPEETYLAVSGGFGLNCPTNTLLMSNYSFKGFIAPPCINDSGLSLGIGLHAFYSGLRKFNFKFKNAYYGSQSDFDVENYKFEYGHYIKNITPLTIEQVVEDIIEDPIVWFNDRAEIGPRALGSRSLLADPRNMESKDKLNIIKKRQWWRPVAPIVLAEEVNEWFESAYESPFMLSTFEIKENKLDKIPSIAHLDNSSRIQSLKKEDNPILYEIIVAFKKNTGIPIVCNTSLNDNDEPIINSIEEVFNFALRKQIKIIYINGFRITLFNHSDFSEEKCAKRKLKVVKYTNENERLKMLQEVNPHGISHDLLTASFLVPKLTLKNYNITNKKDAETFQKIAGKVIKFHDLELSSITGDI